MSNAWSTAVSKPSLRHSPHFSEGFYCAASLRTPAVGLPSHERGLLHSTDYSVVGLVYASSQFHWKSVIDHLKMYISEHAFGACENNSGDVCQNQSTRLIG